MTGIKAWPRATVWIASLLTSLGLVSLGVSTIQWLTSDTLFFPLLYRDLVGREYPPNGWTLSASPYIFPDLLLYFAAELVTPDTAKAIVLCISVSYLIITGLLVWIGRLLCGSTERALVVMAVVSAAVIGLFQLPYYDHLGWTLLFPGVHGGAIMAGLALIGIVVGGLGKENFGVVRTLALLLCASLALIGDPIVVHQFFIPIAVAMIATAIAGYCEYKQAALVVASLTLAYLPLACYEYLVRVLDLHRLTAVPGQAPDLGGQLDTLRRELADVAPFLAKRQTVLGLAAAAWVGYVPFVIRRWWQRVGPRPATFDSLQARRMFVAICFSTTFVLTLAGPAVRGIWADLGNLRYLHPVCFLPPFMLALCLLHRIGLRSRGFQMLSAGILLITAVLIAVRVRTLEAKSFDLPYPDWVACVDDLASRHHLQAGIADYWFAKPLMTFSRKRLHVDQIGPDFLPMLLSANRFWYRGPIVSGQHVRPKYSFLVMKNLDPAAALRKFGEPAYRESCGEAPVWIYNRVQDVAFRNSMLSMTLMLNSARHPSRGISPPKLGNYKLPGHEPDDPDITDPGSGLTARLTPPERGSVLEIGAEANDTYEVTLVTSDGVLANLPVPRTEGMGIQPRYLLLPAQARNKPVVAISIRATGEDLHRRISHVFLYPDSADPS